jgi:hypothetical protein
LAPLGLFGARRRTIGVLDSFIADGKAAVANTLKMAGWGAAIAIAALVAMFFFSLAAFIWAQDSYGTIVACFGLGAFYAVVACATLIAVAVVQRRAAERLPPKSTSQWWADPVVIATGIELVRIVGIRRIVPAVAVGVALFAALQSRPGRTKR